MKNLILFIVAFSVSGVLIAETDHRLRTMGDPQERALGKAESIVYFVDIKNRQLIPVEVDEKTGKPKIQPYRLYRRFEPKRNEGKGAWVYDVVLGSNEISTDPVGFLMKGSTIPGSWAGGDDSTHYFYHGDKEKFEGWDSLPAKSTFGTFTIYEWRKVDPGPYDLHFDTSKIKESGSKLSSIPAHRQ